MRPDPGPDGLTRAARIFYVVAVLSGAVSTIYLVLSLSGNPATTPFRLFTDFAFAAVALVIGRGIERQRRWARGLGYAFGVLELVNIPIGTVIGAAVIVYLHRASKAGLFSG